MTEKKKLTEDEEADEIVRRLATPPTSLSDFQRVMIPVIRKLLPGITAVEILSVQPMSKDEE